MFGLSLKTPELHQMSSRRRKSPSGDARALIELFGEEDLRWTSCSRKVNAGPRVRTVNMSP